MNFELVIDAVFNKDLLNRSSDRFAIMEENIKIAVRHVQFLTICAFLFLLMLADFFFVQRSSVSC